MTYYPHCDIIITIFEIWGEIVDIFYSKAVPENIDKLIDIRIAYLSEDYGRLSDEQTAVIRKSLISYYERHLNSDLFVYTAWDNDSIIGSCFLLVTEKPANPSFPHGRTGTVLNVYTKPEYRRMGIASRLMNELIEDSRRFGLDFIELKATEDGYKLYSSLGFADEKSKYHVMKLIL